MVVGVSWLFKRALTMDAASATNAPMSILLALAAWTAAGVAMVASSELPCRIKSFGLSERFPLR